MFKLLGVLLVVYGFGTLVSYAVIRDVSAIASKRALRLASLWFVDVWKHVVVPSYKWVEQKLIEQFG